MKAEILAPAGNAEAFSRAWAAGADAVYLGYAAFSARAGAGNFSLEELKETIRFAHLQHMRVYVTVNTLLKDAELAEALKLLEQLSLLRADGVLIQDLGLLKLARERFPALTLHASTQMAIHNATGVRWCARMGMKRVVLARECSLEEISRCAQEGPEIEVFCHGAQCVAVSGLCLFSSMVGGRSGNRGRCAQPCRMTYTFRGRKGAFLSPRDVCTRDDLPALAEAGVASLKIEGRLKRPEYVAAVTRSYRGAMDAAAEGRFAPADTGEKTALLQIFNRGGFMRGYAFGSEDAAVIFPESVQHQGVEIGTAEAVAGGMARVRLSAQLHDGDGIRFVGRDGAGEEMRYAGKEVSAGGIAVIRLRPGLKAAAGDRVMRLTDATQLDNARSLKGKEIPIRLRAEAWSGKPLTLTATDGESTVTLQGSVLVKAENRETTPEEIERSLRKTGGTPFTAAAVTVRTGEAFVPVSALNELRRRALAQLAEERIRAFESGTGAAAGLPEESEALPKAGQPAAASPAARSEIGAMETAAPENRAAEDYPAVTVRTAEQAAEARRQGLRLCWYPEDFREAALEKGLSFLQKGDWFHLPAVCEEETLRRLAAWIEAHRSLLGGVVLGSVGQLGLNWPLPVGAGADIPVMNRAAAQLLAQQGCAFVTASPELTGKELLSLLSEDAGIPVPVMTPVYGRTQLMLLHHCPARTALGLRKGHAACALCDEEDARSLRGQRLTDEKGYAFPLLRQRLPEGCLVRLMNALPTDWMDLRIPGGRCLELTEENAAQSAELLRRFRDGRRSEGNTTRGHWSRPTE